MRPELGLLLLVILLLAAFKLPAQPVAASVDYAEAPKARCDGFTMENRAYLTPLEKTCYYRDQLIAPAAVFGAGFFGGVAQALNSPKEWPQGAKGFAWRAGTRYLQGMSKTTAGYLVGLALHEDPRTVRPDCSSPRDAQAVVVEASAPRGFWRRVGGAVAVNFWAKSEDCKAQPVFSASAGALASGFIGMAWTPDSSNTVSNAFVRSATALGGTIASSIFSEFKGDFANLFSKLLDPKPSSNGLLR